MKILVICQYYYPEPFRINDICEELVKKGNEVTVVTGTPNYPMGEIYPGYENNDHKDEIINGVNVHRCPIIPRKTSAIYRLLNYYSYTYEANKYINKLDSSFDIVFIYQLSPVIMAKPGIRYAKKNKKKTVLYCLDLWPASLSVGGVTGGLIYKWFRMESKNVYNSINKIIYTSKSFSDYFEKEFNISSAEYLPQYAEDSFTPEQCKKESDGNIDLMFAGNVGTAQSVETIIKAAGICKDIENLRWHIVGDGKEIENCRNLAKELDAPVIFHGRKSLEEMPKYYSMADAMLVTMQKDPVISLTLPGKVQSYMAAGKPIIAAIDGEAADIIKESGCGICCEAENEIQLADCVRQFISNKDTDYATKSYEYYVNNFSKTLFFDELENELYAYIND